MMNRRRFVRDLGFSGFALLATSALAGCAAGNFGLTRQLGKWNRHFSIIPRVLIYLVFIIIPVYEVTLLFDFLLNNTVEFWTGTPITNAKNEHFEKNGMHFEVAHTRNPLRRSVFTQRDSSGVIQSVSEMAENTDGTIDVLVNGQRKARLKSLKDGFAQIEAYRAGVITNRFEVQEHFIDVADVRARVYPISVVASN